MYSSTNEVSSTMEVLRRIANYLTPGKIIALTWLFGLVMAFPPLIGWSYYGPEPNGLG